MGCPGPPGGGEVGTHTVGKWLSFTVTLPSAASVKKGTKGRFTNASSVAASAMCLEVMDILPDYLV